MSNNLTPTFFREVAGTYPSIGELNEAMIAAYDRHLHEFPGGFGVKRMIEVGQLKGYIVVQPDGSLLVRSPAQ